MTTESGKHEKGRALREMRDERRMTRKELGDLIGSSVRSIARWELGEGDMPEVQYQRAIEVLQSSPEPGNQPRKPSVRFDLSEVPAFELAQELTRRLDPNG